VLASPRCPTASLDWQAREMTVEWITMPTVMRGVTSERATRMAAGDDVVFVAAPGAVQQAEVADLTVSIQGAWRILGGLVVACLAVAGLLRTRLWFLTRQIEAAHLRARR
jgi:hypothetical protein